MKFRWPFSPEIKPVLPPEASSVEAAPVPDKKKDMEADGLGLMALGEIAKTWELSSRIRERLVQRALDDVRGQGR